MTGYDPRYGFDLPTEAEIAAARPRTPLRQRRWVRLLTKCGGVALLVIAVFFVGLRLYWRYVSSQAVEERVAALDRVDRRWRWEDILADQAAPTAGEDGARLVKAAADLLPPDWPSRPAVSPLVPERPTLNPQGLHVIPTSWSQRFEEAVAPGRMQDSLVSALRLELSALTSAVTAARRLREAPASGHFQVDWQALPSETRFPHVDRVRALTSLLRYDAALLAHDGKFDEALASCRAILGAGRALGDEPAVASQQARVQCHHFAVLQLERILAQGAASADALRITQELFHHEAADSQKLLVVALRGERAQVFNCLGLIAGGDLDEDKLPGKADDKPRWQDRLVNWVVGGTRVRYCQADALDLMTAGIQAVELSPAQMHTALAALDDQQRNFLIEHEILGAAISRQFSSYRRIGGMMWRDRVTLQAAELALAAERFRLSRGRWPETLAALVPEFVPAVPIDPYVGAAFQLRRLGDGIVIYSVGPDGVDNGGQLLRGFRFRTEGDIGFQLWDPQHRGGTHARADELPRP